MLEKHLEKKFTTAVRDAGGHAPKLTSPGTNGMPDRLVLLPNGKTGLVELKQHGKKPSPIQKHRHQQLKRLGHTVHILDHPEDIPKVIHEIQTT